MTSQTKFCLGSKTVTFPTATKLGTQRKKIIRIVYAGETAAVLFVKSKANFKKKTQKTHTQAGIDLGKLEHS